MSTDRADGRPSGTALTRVIVVVDDPVVTAAVSRTIDRVMSTCVELLAIEVRRGPSRRSHRLDRPATADRVERALYRPRPDALAPVDLRHSHPDLVARTSTGDGRRESQRTADVVLDLTTYGISWDEARRPQRGVWSLRYGQDRRRLGALAFVAEYLSDADAGVCALLAENGSGQERELYRSVSAVDHLSTARTRNEAAWKSAEFPARVLRQGIEEQGAADAPASEEAQHGPLPTSSAVLGTVVRRTLREAAHRIGQRPSWFVAVRTGREASPWEPGFDTAGFRALTAPPGRFYADPFVVGRPDGGAHVFVEDGPLGGGPARISVVTLDADGSQQSPARAVLERSTHLSYPFVFEDDGTWYMLPETAGTSAVELLRAREFPWRWEPHDVLVRDVRAWDPTLVRHDGMYWLFVTVAAPGARPSDELCLYSAPTLAGPWRPHPGNPIVSDVRRARPAGRVLERDGCLLRPAQDGSGAYGRRIIWNRIEVLTPTDYRETPIGSIEPGWLPGVVRTHTYTADGRFEVLDGVRYEPRPWVRRRRIR